MKRCEIYEVYFDPIIGSEQGGRRPAVIISGNLANDNLKTVIVCPMTSKLKNYHGNLILNPNEKNGLNKKSEVMSIHVRAIAKQRIRKKIGKVSLTEMNIIVESLNKILRY